MLHPGTTDTATPPEGMRPSDPAPCPPPCHGHFQCSEPGWAPDCSSQRDLVGAAVATAVRFQGSRATDRQGRGSQYRPGQCHGLGTYREPRALAPYLVTLPPHTTKKNAGALRVVAPDLGCSTIHGPCGGFSCLFSSYCRTCRDAKNTFWMSVKTGL